MINNVFQICPDLFLSSWIVEVKMSEFLCDTLFSGFSADAQGEYKSRAAIHMDAFRFVW